jgi:hypothetical protein
MWPVITVSNKILTIIEDTGLFDTLTGNEMEYTHFEVFPANKTILVKFFRVLSRVVWYCFRRYRRFEDYLCLHLQGC